jgi:FAD/FMN-containing dehydrogenase
MTKTQIALEAQETLSFDGSARVDVDVERLAAELRQAIRGEVRFDDGSRALYATDASNYRQIPIGVVLPKESADVEAAVEICRRHGAPILARGGGTSLAGQCCNVAVVLDFTKYMNKVLWVDPERKLARVQAGCVLDDLQRQARKHGLRFGPDPATHTHCAIGGMIGNNSCGIHSVLAEFHGPGPRTADNLHSLEVLTYDGLRMEVGPTSPDELEQIIRAGGRRGEIYRKLKEMGERNADLLQERSPGVVRRVSGYADLDQFIPGGEFNVAKALAGSEGTCAVTLEATVHLMEEPPYTSLLVAGYPDIFAAGDHIPLIREHRPMGLEGMDSLLVDYVEEKVLTPAMLALDLLPEGNGFLLIEFGGQSQDEADEKARRLRDTLSQEENSPTTKLLEDERETELIWTLRESGLGATARIPNTPDTWPGWEDTAVHPDKIGAYLRDLRILFDKYGYEAATLVRDWSTAG